MRYLRLLVSLHFLFTVVCRGAGTLGDLARQMVGSEMGLYVYNAGNESMREVVLKPREWNPSQPSSLYGVALCLLFLSGFVPFCPSQFDRVRVRAFCTVTTCCSRVCFSSTSAVCVSSFIPVLSASDARLGSDLRIKFLYDTQQRPRRQQPPLLHRIRRSCWAPLRPSFPSRRAPLPPPQRSPTCHLRLTRWC